MPHDFLKTQKNLRVRESEFESDFRLHYAQVNGLFWLENSKFSLLEEKRFEEDSSRRNKILLHNVTAKKSLLLRMCEFGVPVMLAHAQVDGTLEIYGCEFFSVYPESELLLNLSGIRVQNNLFLAMSEFRGSVSGRNMEVGLDFKFTYGVEDGKRPEAGSRVLQKTRFAASANFSGSSFRSNIIVSELILEDRLSFASCHVGGDFEMDEIEYIANAFLNLTDLAVVGELSFHSFDIKKDRLALNLQEVGHLDLGYPTNSREFQNRLITLLRQAKYNRSSYYFFEQLFADQGYPTLSDHIFVAGKVHARQQMQIWPTSFSSIFQTDFFSWLASWFLFVSLRYGKSPELAFLWSSLLVCVGWWIAKRKISVASVEIFPTRESFVPFWFSLDSFLPFVDLKVSRCWFVEQRRWRVYFRLHTLAGWIIVPLGLAAVAGLVK